MAPSPFVGINPMMANNAVLTEIKSKHQSKLLCKSNLVYSGKRKKDSGFHWRGTGRRVVIKRGPKSK